jgi:hypothetical protein
MLSHAGCRLCMVYRRSREVLGEHACASTLLDRSMAVQGLLTLARNGAAAVKSVIFSFSSTPFPLLYPMPAQLILFNGLVYFIFVLVLITAGRSPFQPMIDELR